MILWMNEDIFLLVLQEIETSHHCNSGSYWNQKSVKLVIYIGFWNAENTTFFTLREPRKLNILGTFFNLKWPTVHYFSI